MEHKFVWSKKRTFLKKKPIFHVELVKKKIRHEMGKFIYFGGWMAGRIDGCWKSENS
mgnify:CR=1 FL=1